WALATDAATPISGWRRGLLDAKGLSAPPTWGELIALARLGMVAVPGIPIDSLMHFFMMCVGLGEPPFAADGVVASEPTGVRALELLRELYSLISPECRERNPIRTWELLTATDKVAYCPFAYGYSNYSRAGVVRYPLETGSLITLQPYIPYRSTLG